MSHQQRDPTPAELIAFVRRELMNATNARPPWDRSKPSTSERMYKALLTVLERPPQEETKEAMRASEHPAASGPAGSPRSSLPKGSDLLWALIAAKAAIDSLRWRRVQCGSCGNYYRRCLLCDGISRSYCAHTPDVSCRDSCHAVSIERVIEASDSNRCQGCAHGWGEGPDCLCEFCVGQRQSKDAGATPSAEGATESAQNLSSSPVPLPDAAPSPKVEGCVNCGEVNDGGYMSGGEGMDAGNVGPFCSMCWEFLREHFHKIEPPAPLASPPAKEQE